MNLCGVCSDAAQAMLGSKCDFQTLLHKKATDVITTQCFIYRETLALKTFRDGPCAFDLIIKLV